MRKSLLSTIALVACSSNPPPKPAGTVNAATARSSVSSLSDVSSAMAAGDASSAAGAVMALTAAGETVVTPSGTSPRIDIPRTWPTGHTYESFTGSASCTPDSCTFDHYGDADQYGSYEINGTISKSGDTLTFDLALDVTATSSSLHWTIDGALTITPSLIDGSVHSHGTASSTQYQVTWDVDVDFQSIGLDASGCAVSGALAASVSVQDGNASYAAAGTIHFGPACGEVSL